LYIVWYISTYGEGTLPVTVVGEDGKEIIRNLYLSGIAEEFIAMQLDLEIPIVVAVLKELGAYEILARDQ
jgi:hypothetical protein